MGLLHLMNSQTPPSLTHRSGHPLGTFITTPVELESPFTCGCIQGSGSPTGHLVLAGGTLDCHSWGGVTGTYWVEARDAAKYPTVHKTALTTKSSSPKCQCW